MKKLSIVSVSLAFLFGLAFDRAAIILGVRESSAAQAAPLEQRLKESSDAMAAMLKSARNTYESIPFGGDAGTAGYADLYFWSCRWLQAERLRTKGNEENIPALRAHWERMNAVHQKISALHGANAKGGEADKFHAASYFLAEAELWLLRAGGAVPQAEQTPRAER